MPVAPLRFAMLSVHSCPLGSLGTKDTGGMSVYIREVASELGRRGHIVDVFTRTHDPADPQVIELGRNARLIHLRAGAVEGVHKLAVYSHLPEFACNVEAFRRADDLRYDIIFSHYWLSGEVGDRLQQWWGVPQLVMFHTLGAAKNAAGSGEDEPELRIETEKGLARSAALLVAATEREKRDLVLYCGAPAEKVAVVPCGVNLARFHPVGRKTARQSLGIDGGRVILFAGRIESLKGLETLLRAIPLLGDGNARLLVAGGDEHSRGEVVRLEGIARSMGIAAQVSFPGSIPHEEMPVYYSAADVCVLPSRYESFGLVALEALACGTPVIATDVGGIRDFVQPGKTGYIIPDMNPQRLAEKLALVLAGSGVIEDPSRIRASVLSWGWDNTALSLIARCRQLQAGPVPAAAD